MFRYDDDRCISKGVIIVIIVMIDSRLIAIIGVLQINWYYLMGDMTFNVVQI